MDTPTILALINLGGLVFAIYQLERQRKDTQDLAHLTSELEHRVHRLAISLDQRIYRLTRIRDLITGLMHVSVGLRQRNRPFSDKLELAVKREMTLPELAALVDTVDDVELSKLFAQLRDVLLDNIWPNMWNEKEYDMGTADELLKEQNTCIRFMPQRILELLEDATHVAED